MNDQPVAEAATCNRAGANPQPQTALPREASVLLRNTAENERPPKMHVM